MKDGKKLKLNIISRAGYKWKDIAQQLSDEPGYIERVDQAHRGEPTECLRQVLTDRFMNARPEKYTLDWNGVIELFEDVGLGNLGAEVKIAIVQKV